MYKVMLIDDEKSIRKLMRLSIDWEKYDMEIAGEAASGIEALNIIDDIKPDVCFVDIRMPFMDGIEFSKIAISRYPQLVINILTAYDDFQYARQCIGVGIHNYFLKPIVSKDIAEELKKLKEKLNTRGEQQEEVSLPVKESSFQAILDYIREHAQEPDLNLGRIAQEFGFNASYLSRKFKNEANCSFVDYLNGIRMEKAKKLAALGRAMYQAAMEVGIPDPNYFSKCFKKYEGMNYSDYAKQYKD